MTNTFNLFKRLKQAAGRIFSAVKNTKRKVFYGSGFWNHSEKNKKGKEIHINKSFAQKDEIWHIPSVYYCSRGLTADICIEVNTQKLKTFTDKYEWLSASGKDLSGEDEERLLNENPLNIDFNSSLVLNGKKLNMDYGSCTAWIPESCLPEGEENSPEAEKILSYYRLDKNKGWSLHRCSYPWQKKEKIKSLSVQLKPSPTEFGGIHFKDPKAGEVITFAHPVSGKQHKLTVEENSPRTFDFSCDSEYEFPCEAFEITFTAEPYLSPENFYIKDCAVSDKPRHKQPRDDSKQKEEYESMGIIGGADGPTEIFISENKNENTRRAVSALHFEPPRSVEWKMIFREKLTEDKEIKLI